MTTIALLRTTYLNGYLARGDADAKPWSLAECNAFLSDAMTETWPDNGLMVQVDLTSDANTDSYSLTTVERVSRVSLLDDYGREIDRITDWRPAPSDKLILHPVLSSGLTIRVYGWKRFAADASDLPVSLESAVAAYAAGLAYGALAASVSNSQRQQNIDSGRVVDQPTAAAMSAYWTRRAELRFIKDPSRVTLAPRRARR